jgi:hypothetical protein
MKYWADGKIPPAVQLIADLRMMTGQYIEQMSGVFTDNQPIIAASTL